jgi:hypothetical protein
MNQNESPFMQKIAELQNSYYDQNKKNTFFKNNQKLKCAEVVVGNIDMSELLHNCCFHIPHSNKIFYNYQVFKTFAQPDNYEIIIDYIIHLMQQILTHHSQFEVHVNIQSFTVSAAQRYKDCILLFLQKCNDHILEFSDKLSVLKVYFSPSSIETIKPILMPLIPPQVKSKMMIFDKESSAGVLWETCNIRI